MPVMYAQVQGYAVLLTLQIPEEAQNFSASWATLNFSGVESLVSQSRVLRQQSAQL